VIELDVIARSNLDFTLALERRLQQRIVQRQMRRCLEAIDKCLADLEELHVNGAPLTRRHDCRGVVAGLISRAGEEPPAGVQMARTSYELHSALLDWESAVLDGVVSDRRERYPDLTEERDQWRRPRRRRSRHQ